jgi:hypothetical protein
MLWRGFLKDIEGLVVLSFNANRKIACENTNFCTNDIGETF